MNPRGTSHSGSHPGKSRGNSHTGILLSNLSLANSLPVEEDRVKALNSLAMNPVSHELCGDDNLAANSPPRGYSISHPEERPESPELSLSSDSSFYSRDDDAVSDDLGHFDQLINSRDCIYAQYICVNGQKALQKGMKKELRRLDKEIKEMKR